MQRGFGSSWATRHCSRLRQSYSILGDIAERIVYVWIYGCQIAMQAAVLSIHGGRRGLGQRVVGSNRLSARRGGFFRVDPAVRRRTSGPTSLSICVCTAATGERDASDGSESLSTASTASTASTTRVKQMTWSLLAPDLPLLVLTITTLVVSVLVTLGFPLALGELFDIIRRNLTTLTADNALPAVMPMWSTTLPTYVSLVKTAAAAAPPDFHPTLIRLCACLVLSSMGNASSGYLASLVGERFGKRLRKQTMRRLVQKSQLFYDSHPRGELISRLNSDCTAVQTTLTEFLGQRGVRSVVEILFSLIIITIKNPLSAIISFTVTPAITLAMRGIVKRSAALTVERQEAAAASMAYATERIANVRTVQLFGQEGREGRAYAGLCEEEYGIAKEMAWFQGLVEGAGRFAVNMGALSLLAIGGVLVLAGRMEVGTLLAFQVYNFFLTIGLGSLSASLGDLGKVGGALSRLEEVLRVEEGEEDRECDVGRADGSSVSAVARQGEADVDDDPEPMRIEFSHVYFKYPNSKDWVLKDVSFEAAPGQTVALVGQSGSGKSTIAALLLGLYEPQKGEIYVDGELLTREHVERVRSKVGTMFQQPGIMSGTIEEQIRMGKPDATNEEVTRAVELSHCKEFINQISSSGLNYQVGERGKNLSGGQQQRLALARALVRRPQMLLLDEPTAALDAVSEQYIDMTLADLTCTKVVIAHRLSTIRNADVIIVVDQGRIVERGTHDELVRIPDGKYANMLSFA